MKKLLTVLAMFLMMACQKDHYLIVQQTIIPNTDIIGNWTGTDKHYYYGNYEGTYNVNMIVADTTVTINYQNDAPANRNNPNVWTYSPYFSDNNLQLKISSTYTLQIQFNDKNHVTIKSNNGDELFMLQRAQ